MAKWIGDRATDAFENADAHTIEKYLDYLVGVWAECASAMRRSMTLALVVAAIFELVAVNSEAEALDVGPLTLTTGSSVRSFLPTVCAYIFFEAVVQAQRYRRIGNLFTASFGAWSPDAEKQDLDVEIRPRSSLLWDLYGRVRPELASPTDPIEYYLLRGFQWLAVVAFGAFQVHAFVLLFDYYGFTSIVVWVNAVATVLLSGGITFYFIRLSSVD